MQQASCQAVGKGVSHALCYLDHWKNLTQLKFKKKIKWMCHQPSTPDPLPRHIQRTAHVPENNLFSQLPNTRAAPEAGLVPGLIGCAERVIPMGKQPSVRLQGNWLPPSSSLPHTWLFCSVHKAYLCSSVSAYEGLLLFQLTFHFPMQSFTNLWQGSHRMVAVTATSLCIL